MEPFWRVLLSDDGVKQISCPSSSKTIDDATAKRLKLRHQASIAGTKAIGEGTYHLTDLLPRKAPTKP